MSTLVIDAIDEDGIEAHVAVGEDIAEPVSKDAAALAADPLLVLAKQTAEELLRGYSPRLQCLGATAAVRRGLVEAGQKVNIKAGLTNPIRPSDEPLKVVVDERVNGVFVAGGVWAFAQA